MTVTGTTAAGQHGLRRRDEHRRQLGDDDGVDDRVGATGTFSVDVPVTGGTSVINVVAVSPTGGDRRTSSARSSSTSCRAPCCSTSPTRTATTTGRATTPTRRRTTSRPGAFDIQRFQVLDDGDERHLPRADPRPHADVRQPARRAARRRLRARPGARRRPRPRPSFPQRNYQIAPAFAWSQLIQVQGFGQRFVDAGGATLGTVTIQRQRDLALHHVQRPEGSARAARRRAGVHRRADRPGRVQPRPGARLRPDAAGLPVRRLRGGEHRPALHGRPGHGAEGDRRAHARPASSSRTSSTTRSTPGRAAGRDDSLAAPRRMIRSATSPVQPVWCDAPRPSPVSPWKYSWNGIRSRQAGSRLEEPVAAEHGPPAVLAVAGRSPSAARRARRRPAPSVSMLPGAGRELDREPSPR